MAQSIRQFVIMPLGSDYTVETQITGADLIGGLQVEVTPVKRAQSRLYNPNLLAHSTSTYLLEL
jgi:hypothetical protein